MRTMWIISLLVFMVTSCFEEDVMVVPHEQGDLEVGMAGQGPNYGLQVYFGGFPNHHWLFAPEMSRSSVHQWVP